MVALHSRRTFSRVILVSHGHHHDFSVASRGFAEGLGDATRNRLDTFPGQPLSKRGQLLGLFAHALELSLRADHSLIMSAAVFTVASWRATSKTASALA